MITDAELVAEYKLTKNFIDRHSREMGGRGRPRRFIRENVEAFLRKLHEATQIDARAIAAAGAEDRKVIDAAVRGVVGPGEVGDIAGRGGRGLKAMGKGAAA
jgi:hypothetical protein